MTNEEKKQLFAELTDCIKTGFITREHILDSDWSTLLAAVNQRIAAEVKAALSGEKG